MVSDAPAPVHRRLTDDERELMADLAIAVVAHQTGASDQAAADALADLADRGQLHLCGDNVDAYLQTSTGHVIVHVTREWLAFFATYPDEHIDLDDYLTPIPADKLNKARELFGQKDTE